MRFNWFTCAGTHSRVGAKGLPGKRPARGMEGGKTIYSPARYLAPITDVVWD